MVVRRSALRMWVVALVGVPLVVIGTDVLTRRRLTNALRDMLFRPEDTQIFEPRDVIWAWAMLVVGVLLVGLGLKELMFPTTVVAADGDGMRLKLSGPLRPVTVVPWSAVEDIGSGSVADEGDRLPVLWVRLFDPDSIPMDPWGARWIDDRTVAILASDWDRSAVRVARELTQAALAATPPPSDADLGTIPRSAEEDPV